MYKEFNKLVEKAQAGDLSSKEEILERLKPLILKQMKSYYNNMENFDDLYQEGNLIVLECLEDFDPDKARFLAYVQSQLRFHYLNRHKIRTHLSLNQPVGEDGDEEVLDMLESDQINQEEGFIRLETRSALGKAIDKLTKRQKEVVLAFYGQGLPMQAIADSLGISYRTVVNTKTMAIERLRSIMVN